MFDGIELIGRSQKDLRPIRGKKSLHDLPGPDDCVQPGAHASATRSPRRWKCTAPSEGKEALKRAADLSRSVGVPEPGRACNSTRTNSAVVCDSEP